MLSGFASLLLLLVLTLLMVTFAYGAISAAPWVPLPHRDVQRLLDLANIKPGELVCDLGCGDGRLVVAAAKIYQARAIGFEIALIPYFIARVRILLAGVGDRVQVRYQNFWHVPLTPADIVICFLTPPAMTKLEAKTSAELKPTARLISYAFRLHNRTPRLVSKPKSTDAPIYLYS